MPINYQEKYKIEKNPISFCLEMHLNRIHLTRFMCVIGEINLQTFGYMYVCWMLVYNMSLHYNSQRMTVISRTYSTEMVRDDDNSLCYNL